MFFFKSSYFISSSMSESKDKNKNFPDIPFNGSGSFHATDEGKVWIRLLINLCWWLHDMYEVDSINPDAKFQYIEQQISQCQTLFPAEFTLMFSDPTFSPDDQHPLLICRQEEHKIIILVFRATVSTKSIQDVFTDASIHSNHKVYLGSRHSGFSRRAETAPLLAVTNWLRRGWKVIITGHSLGGAVSQLFTAHIISKLVEAGLSPGMISLRCVTFGTPQCADHHFWSTYTDWYDAFDSYVYGNDAIFRLATFGADVAKKLIDSFGGYLKEIGVALCTKLIGYSNEDQTHILVKATDQIRNISHDALIPVYSMFGRHHFIHKDEKSQLKIDSIGGQEDEKNRLLGDLSTGRCWYDYFIEKKMIPDQFNFIYREFMEHGCYPFSINQLFNREINSSWDKKRSIKPKLFRIGANNRRKMNNQASDISAIINFPDENNSCYIYFQGFLADFITSVKVPVELAESEKLREKTPTLSPDQPDVYAILCFKSNTSIKYLQTHSVFEVKVTTYFGCINVQVAVLSNFSSTRPSAYQLDPIETILRAYDEFILDTTSIEQIDSPLSRCFSLFFSAFKRIGQNEFDIIMARYWAEAEARNLFSDTAKHIHSIHLPETKDAATTYFNELLKSLSERAETAENGSETERNASFLYKALKREVSGIYPISPSSSWTEDEASVEKSELIPLHLDFIQLRKCLHDLHTVYELSSVERNIRMIRAPYFFIIIKLKRLHSVKQYTIMEKMVQGVQIFWSKKLSVVAGLTGLGGGVGTTATAAAVGATGATAAGAATNIAAGSAVNIIMVNMVSGVGATAAGAAGMAGATAAGAAGMAGATAAGAAGMAGATAAGAAGMAGATAAGATGMVGATAAGAAVAAATILAPIAVIAGVCGAAYSAWCSMSERHQLFGDYEKIIKPFIEVAATLLASTESVDVTDKNENIWQILNQISNCHSLRQLTQSKSTEERDVIWTQTFTKNPFKSVSLEDRWYFVSVIDICCQLTAMRQILARQPPKVVIIGQSQTGKTTLFKHLTKRNSEQLCDITNFNTRMSLQCPAFIELDGKSSDDKITGGSGLPIDIIDSPGYDDATGLSDILLNLSLKAANLIILMTTLRDINQLGIIDQLNKLLHNTHVNILVLINQVDLKLKNAWEIFRKTNLDNNKDSDDDDDGNEDELNREFSRCETLDTLVKRPIRELSQKLKVDPSVVKKRVTFQPVILKGFNEFNKTFNEPDFRNKVHKSNVNKWITQNLINCSD
jgi:GTP-binding protein EngB required for normal cell division